MSNSTAYWRKPEQRMSAEGNETVANCHGLKMKAADGKMRVTDVADPELTIDRALEQYLNPGYSENRINQRLKSIEIRKALIKLVVLRT